MFVNNKMPSSGRQHKPDEVFKEKNPPDEVVGCHQRACDTWVEVMQDDRGDEDRDHHDCQDQHWHCYAGREPVECLLPLRLFFVHWAFRSRRPFVESSHVQAG